MWEGNLPAIGMRAAASPEQGPHPSRTRGFSVRRSSTSSDTATPTTTTRSPDRVRGLEVVDSLGLRGLAPGLPDIGGILKVSFPGTALTGLSQIDAANPGFLNRIHQIQDQVTWLRGTHSLKFGTDIRRVDYEDTRSLPASLFSWLGQTSPAASTGHPYADFLLGLPNTGSRAFPPVPSLRRRWTYDFFVQDDWKVGRNLTVNLGLRYDLHPGWVEREGRLAFFDITSGAIVVADEGANKISPLMPSAYVGIVSAGSQGLPSDTLVRTDRNNFAPRLGVAYRPFNDSQTVIRAGYGLYYDLLPIELQAARAPFVFTVDPVHQPRGAEPSCCRRCFLRQARRDRRRSRCRSRSTRTCGCLTAISGASPSSTSGGAPDSVCRTSARSAATCGTRATPTRPRPTGVSTPRNHARSRSIPSITYADNGASHDYHGVTFEGEAPVLGQDSSFRRPTPSRRTPPKRWNGPTRSRIRSTWRANAAATRPRRCTA